jgi:phosphatidate phosphatase APP1
VYLVEGPDEDLANSPVLDRTTVTSTLGGGFKYLSRFSATHSKSGRHLQDAQLRVVSELLPVEEDATEGSAPGRIDSALIKVHPSNIVRVMSDIDDTVKHTQVLRGIRTVFRNVFTLPFDRISVPVGFAALV